MQTRIRKIKLVVFRVVANQMLRDIVWLEKAPKQTDRDRFQLLRTTLETRKPEEFVCFVGPSGYPILMKIATIVEVKLV